MWRPGGGEGAGVCNKMSLCFCKRSGLLRDVAP